MMRPRLGAQVSVTLWTWDLGAFRTLGCEKYPCSSDIHPSLAKTGSCFTSLDTDFDSLAMEEPTLV